MFGPGGTDLSSMVLREMYRPYVNPWSEGFIAFYEDTLALLKNLCGTRQDMLIMMGPIRAAMDTTVCSLVEPGEKVAVCVNGYWSELFTEIVESHGGVPVVVEGTWGLPFDAQRLAEALDKNGGQIQKVLANHVETSTGVVNPVAEIGRVVKSRGLIYVLDCAQSMGGMPIKMDDWGVDFCLGGNHKCMSAPAGLGFIGISQDGWKAIRGRRTPIKGWYTNIETWRDVWMERNRVWFTFPSSTLFALRAVLDHIFKEGPEQIYGKYERAAKAIRWGVSEMGLDLYVDGSKCPGCDSPARFCADTATPIVYPRGIGHDRFAEEVSRSFGITIGGGLGKNASQVFRVGPTGIVQITPGNVIKLLSAIGLSMRKVGVSIDVEAGLTVASSILEG